MSSDVSEWSLGKRLSYGMLIALIVFAAGFISLEMLLRICGFGYSGCYYRNTSVNDVASVRENRWFTAPYFSPELVRRPPPMLLPASKAPSTYRIFVMGGSAAMGDPEASFSMTRVLQTMLDEAYPEIHFEVVNAAVTAINSHVVKQIAADCSRLQPDLFIVYVGNNEVIGPFGPASVFLPFIESPRGVAMVTWLRKTRTGQAFSWGLRQFGHQSKELEQWGGMEMFLDRQFTADDPRLNLVATLFQDNLSSIIQSGADSDAHTLLCTVLTNRRDFAPFLSAESPDLSSEQKATWDSLVADGDAALSAGKMGDAYACYNKAWAIDDSHADLAFRLGRLELGMDAVEDARRHLQLAEDLDTLRFRADSRLNGVIRSVAANYPDEAILVDLLQQAEKESPFGIVGNEFLYEHVHLTFQGTYFASGKLFEQISVELKRKNLIQAIKPHLDYRGVSSRMAYTAYDQALIVRELLARFSMPPFTGQLDHASRVALWQSLQAKVDSLLNRPEAFAQINSNYIAALALHPDDAILNRNYGMMLVAFGHFSEAVGPLQYSLALIDDDPDTLFALAIACRELQLNEVAESTIARLRLLEPRYPGLKDLETLKR
ncbi:MAG: hypothetical protein JW739_06985 [Opitutales bacterium]|nr:hypothetical protein [Opitutales bacterium]